LEIQYRKDAAKNRVLFLKERKEKNILSLICQNLKPQEFRGGGVPPTNTLYLLRIKYNAVRTKIAKLF
jgi:hypothetical protein